MRAQRGVAKVKLFFNSALGGGGQNHSPVVLPSEKSPVTNCIGGWVRLNVEDDIGLTAVRSENRSSPGESPIPTALSRLFCDANGSICEEKR